MSPTYDPQTKLFYVTAREQCDVFSTAPQPYDAGHAYYGSAYFPNDDAQPFYGALRAIDPGDRKNKMGVEASFADVVRSVVDGGRNGVYGRRGREFYCAGRSQRQSAVAFPVRRFGVFVSDDILD